MLSVAAVGPNGLKAYYSNYGLNFVQVRVPNQHPPASCRFPQLVVISAIQCGHPHTWNVQQRLEQGLSWNV